MLRTATWAVALLVFIPLASAQGADRGTATQSASDQFKQLVEEFESKQAEFQEAIRAAENRDEMMKIRREMSSLPRDYAEKFLEFAEKHSDKPVAAEALVWVASNAPRSRHAREAIEQLAENHLESDKLGPVCAQMARGRSSDNEKFLRAVLEKNPHREVQGIACLNLGMMLNNKRNQEEAETLLQRVVDSYGDVSYRGRTLAKAAEDPLYIIRHLSIGKVAPEIEGEDIDGVEFKLSDYRGKVVVLDFWGDW